MFFYEQFTKAYKNVKRKNRVKEKTQQKVVIFTKVEKLSLTNQEEADLKSFMFM